MTFQQEIGSWKTPKELTTFPVPEVGERAPTSSILQTPSTNGKPTIITFLRHCGCPFAEKTFQRFRKFAGKHTDINFVAVSHSDDEATEKWLISIGGCWEVQVVVDAGRETYAQWGLGVANTWHVLNPWSLYSVYKLGKQESIWNKPTESGNRWQMSGSFAVDEQGVVKWVRVAKSADDIPDFKDGLKALGREV
ncbi:Thioredoxin-like protein [Venustampulla echinocandica]|uniref:Thioredoxin-like protein n=1 Tax=Venustampulla echinocandica TaxID=2656787 RepID=A0A370TYU4_9HELO|nr:Thioredoxin-like protein [Venustampulla echinocandica]RDL40681.1 Thioredoxin-like protein [Venustampulla echinocandica]